MIQLRDYQIKIIEDIRVQFKKGLNRIILQLGTGGGKTVIFTQMIKTASERGNKCLILTDRFELLEQAGGTFDRIGLSYENITAETKKVPSSRVLVAMVETIKRRAKSRLDFQMLLRSINVLVIDEAHKQNFDDVFQYLNKDCYVIGATATPIRTNVKKPLREYFNEIVLGPSIVKLISNGYLAHPIYYGVQVDLSNVKMKAGEFDENDMTKVYSDVKVFEGLKHNLELHAKGLKTMIFCPSVESSKQVASELNCLHIDGTINKSDRERILTKFENTPGSIISNCAITTTGYDCPDIECIVLYRATASLPLYLQMIGRGSRTTKDKKSFKILDFGMNVHRHGYWHIDRKWSLDPPKKKSKKTDTFPVKFCPSCGAILPAQTKTCSECGYIYPITEKERIFAELEQLTYTEVNKLMSNSTIEEMEQIRVSKNYKVGFVLHKFTERWQFEEYAKIKNYNPKWVDIQVKNYL